MRTIAWYDGEAVDAVAVAAAEMAAGGSVVHVRAADSAWPDGLDDAVVLPGRRDAEFLDILAAALDTIAAQVAADPALRRATTIGGVDLLEVVRYEWLYAAAGPAHRAWVVRRLLDEHHPQRLLWVSDGRDRSFGGALTAAVAGAEIVSWGSTAAPGVAARLSGAFRLRAGQRRLRAMGNAATSLIPATLPLPVAEQPRAVLLDQYPHTARALAAACAPLTAAGLTPLAVGTDDAVAAACADHLPAVALPAIAPRRARLAAVVAARRAAVAARRAVAAAVESRLAPFGDLAPLLEPAFGEATATAWADAARRAVFVGSLLERSEPALLATTSIVASSIRAAALLARRRGGPPTAWVQHGILRTPDWKTRYVQDQFVAWGECDRRKLVAAGVPAEAVRVTGSPVMEVVAGSAAGARTAEAFTVLYLPSRSGGNLVSHDAAHRMVLAVATAVRSLPGCHLVVKPHPGDRSATFDGLGDDVEVRVGVDVVAEIRAADAVVVATSTAGLEACALDRPVVALAWPGIELAEEYTGYGAALLASDASEVTDALRAVRDDLDVGRQLAEGRCRLVGDLFAGLEPGAGGRVLAALAEAAGHGAHASHEPDTRPVVAWYELDEVADADVAAVLAAAAGRPVLHAHRADARWSARPPEGGRLPLPSHRDPDVRDQLMDMLDEAVAELRVADRRGRLRVGGHDLLDVGRYDLFHRFAPVAHRAWVARRLAAEHDLGALLWAAPRGEASGLALALRAALGERVEARVVPTGRPGRPGGAERAGRLRRAKRSLRDLKRLASAVVVAPVAPCPRPEVLLVEQFPRGAGVSARVAAALPTGTAVRLIAGDDSVLAAVTADSLGGVLAGRATSRGARVRAELAARRARAAVPAAVELLADPSRSPWGRWAPLIGAGAAEALGHALPAAARAARVADDILRRWSPVVVASSTGAPALVRAVAGAARRRGLPACFVQHGMLLLYRYRWHLCHDHFLVWGQADRRTLEHAGVAPGNVRVCGSPQFESLGGRPPRPAGAERTTALYLPSRTGGRFVTTEQAAAMLEAVVAARPPGAELVVKPHPSDPSHLFDALEAGAVPGVRVVRSADPLEAIEAAHVVIVATSTAGLEAVALDRPVVVLAWPGVEVPDELVRYGATLVAGDAGALADAVTAAVGPASDDLAAARRAFVDDLLDGLRPGAAARAAAALAELVDGGAWRDAAPGTR